MARALVRERRIPSRMRNTFGPAFLRDRLTETHLDNFCNGPTSPDRNTGDGTKHSARPMAEIDKRNQKVDIFRRPRHSSVVRENSINNCRIFFGRKSEPFMTTPPVLIIGAGIGGLTLGRALKQLGIAVKIFDCRSSIAPHSDRGLGIWEQSQVTRFVSRVVVDAWTRWNSFRPSLQLSIFESPFDLKTGGCRHVCKILGSESILKRRHTMFDRQRTGILAKTCRLISSKEFVDL
jgi:hypothetical protein